MTAAAITEEELIGISDQVRYELDMLLIVMGDWLDCYYQTKTPEAVQDEAAVALRNRNNYLLEAFAIHARSLYQFLYFNRSSRTHRNNVLAVDYFKQAAPWMARRPKSLIWLKEAVTAASQEIAHVGKARYPFVDKHDWQPPGIAAALVCVLDQFISAADCPPLDLESWPSGARIELNQLAGEVRRLVGDDDYQSGYGLAMTSAWMHFRNVRKYLAGRQRQP